MPSIEAASLYFGAERAAALLIACVGLVGLELAWSCWRKGRTAQARGAAAVLVLMAGLHLAVGGTVFVRSPDDLQRVSQAVGSDRTWVRTEELPRMQAVMHNFQVYRWAEISLLLAGGIGAVVGRRGTWVRGAGMTLAAHALLLGVFDSLAAQRGAEYLAWLQTI